jgi:hypothetical protein
MLRSQQYSKVVPSMHKSEKISMEPKRFDVKVGYTRMKETGDQDNVYTDHNSRIEAIKKTFELVIIYKHCSMYIAIVVFRQASHSRSIMRNRMFMRLKRFCYCPMKNSPNMCIHRLHSIPIQFLRSKIRRLFKNELFSSKLIFYL